MTDVISDGSKILADGLNSNESTVFTRGGVGTTIPKSILSGVSRLTKDGKKAIGTLNGAPAIYTFGKDVQTYPVPPGYENGAVGDASNGEILLATAFKPPGTSLSYVVVGDAIRPLPDLGTNTLTQAAALSDRGFVVVGNSDGRPVRWTNVASPVVSALTDNPGFASDVSRDGSVIVGRMLTGSTNVAFRWTQSAGALALPLPNGSSNADAVAVSGDGSVVLGNAVLASSSTGESRPFVWTKTTGSRRVEDFVNFGGVPFGGMTDVRAAALSDDGKTVVGTGRLMIGSLVFERGFVLSLP